jgi:hypothetical protein
VRQPHDRCGTGAVVGGGEIAALGGMHADRGEEIRGNLRDRDLLGAVGRLELAAIGAINREGAEHVLSRVPVLEIRVGDVRIARLGQVDEAVRLRVGQGAQERQVDEAEDRGVRPDAEGERQHHDRGKAGRLGEQAEGVAQVVHGERKTLS